MCVCIYISIYIMSIVIFILLGFINGKERKIFFLSIFQTSSEWLFVLIEKFSKGKKGYCEISGCFLPNIRSVVIT